MTLSRKVKLMWIQLIFFSFLQVTGAGKTHPSLMILVSDSSGPLCATDPATTVFTARSLVDCQRRCSTHKTKCYAANFYSDTKTCEMYNFKPTTFTSSITNCRLFSVEAVSWGIDDSKKHSGYIAIDGTRVINTTSHDYRGFNLIELKVSSCSSSNILHFDTNENTTNSENMATYITSLPLNTVLIGITSDDAQNSLTQNAKSALLAIGVNVTGLEFRGKVSFVAQIGQPTLSVSQVAPAGGENAKISDSVTGYQSTSVSSSSTGDIQNESNVE